MDVELTKESRKALKEIYELYCYRRKEGMSKSAAVKFGDDIEIDGISDAKTELSNAGLITYFISGDFDLTDKAIIYMETFTKDAIRKWLEFGSNFIP